MAYVHTNGHTNEIKISFALYSVHCLTVAIILFCWLHEEEEKTMYVTEVSIFS